MDSCLLSRVIGYWKKNDRKTSIPVATQEEAFLFLLLCHGAPGFLPICPSPASISSEIFFFLFSGNRNYLSKSRGKRKKTKKRDHLPVKNNNYKRHFFFKSIRGNFNSMQPLSNYSYGLTTFATRLVLGTTLVPLRMRENHEGRKAS